MFLRRLAENSASSVGSRRLLGDGRFCEPLACVSGSIAPRTGPAVPDPGPPSGAGSPALRRRPPLLHPSRRARSRCADDHRQVDRSPGSRSGLCFSRRALRRDRGRHDFAEGYSRGRAPQGRPTDVELRCGRRLDAARRTGTSTDAIPRLVVSGRPKACSSANPPGLFADSSPAYACAVFRAHSPLRGLCGPIAGAYSDSLPDLRYCRRRPARWFRLRSGSSVYVEARPRRLPCEYRPILLRLGNAEMPGVHLGRLRRHSR